MLVAIIILSLILACVIPYVLASREASRRVQCQNNLRLIFYGMANYQKANHPQGYPRTRFDLKQSAWTAYTGADDANPFRADSSVAVNDVTASLWLMVRTGYLPDTSVFVCPSSDRVRDPMTNLAGAKVRPDQRGNFRSHRHLSYSILSPFNPLDQDTWAWNDTLPSEVALLSDMNPGVGGDDDVASPQAGDDARRLQLANSRNHGKRGQNVLYAGGNVAFVPHAFVGMGYARAEPQNKLSAKMGDNIFTSLRGPPKAPDGAPLFSGPGAFGTHVAPSWTYDSYLIPSDDQ
jgi:type II secretory pathway pseudopilin PulG